MTKDQFLAHVRAIYQLGNLADSDNPERPDWVHPNMAGSACCQHLDAMLREMVREGVLTSEEHQAFYDTI